MSNLFDAHQAGHLSEISGCHDVDALARCVLDCGFDPEEYSAETGDPALAQFRFAWDQFDNHARQTVARYGQFLDRLTMTAHRDALRVCSVCPTGLTDEKWIKAFIRLHTNASSFDLQIVKQIHRYEVPGMRVRNEPRAHFNGLPRRACDLRDIAFVDDFSPFVDADGMTAERFPPGGDRLDHHLDFRRSEAGFVNNPRLHALASRPMEAVANA